MSFSDATPDPLPPSFTLKVEIIEDEEALLDAIRLLLYDCHMGHIDNQEDKTCCRKKST
jgi:hypothetical protein